MDISEFSGEETAKLTAMLDDGTKASIGTMFIGREHNGCITMEQLTEMMTELQVAFDTDMLKVVSEENWERIDLDQSTLVIAYCIDAAQKQVAQQAKADSAVVVTQAAQPVVYLNTLQYLIHLTPCATKEKGVEYRWNKVKVDVRPKTILMVSVGVMMVFAAIALISATIGLNERATTNQAQDALDHLSVTVDTSTLVLLDEAVRSVVADSLRSTSEVTSAVSDGLLLAHQEVLMEQLKVGLTQARSAFVSVADDAAADRTQQLVSKVDTVSILFQAEAKDALVAFAKDALTHGTMIFLADSSGSLVQPSICSGSTSPLFAQTTAIETQGMESACDAQLFYACSFIYNSGTRVCIVETQTVRHDHQRLLLDEVVTEVNSQRPDKSIELQAALEPETEDAPFVSVGGRKKLPMLCLRSQECNYAGQEIFEWAHNSTETGTRIVTGYDTSLWLASYGRVTVSEQEILLGLKEDVEESKSRFFTALGEGTSKNRNATLSPLIVFAVADSLERVELLPINETTVSTAQDTYLGYALNGRQGISYPTISDISSLMSGYSSALEGDLAVGIEYTAAEVSASATDFVVQTLSALNTKLPSNWEVVVAKEINSGEVTYVIPLKHACPAAGCLPHTAMQEAMSTQFGGRTSGTDYRGASFEGWFFYYNQSPPLIVVVQYSTDDLWKVILERRYIALGVGVAIIVAVQLIILLLTRRVLDRIESDYNKYKRQIEDEKHQFSELVKDVMPPYIAERIMKGTRLIAETHPQLTFFFSDIVGSTESSKTMTNKHLVRMLGYSFMLEDEIANHFGVHKIKTIGDAYFAVSGLEDNLAGGNAQSQKEHQVYRMVSFACICQQLFGPTYQHYPERTECFRLSAGTAKLEPMKMVRMRMGIHTGPAVAGVVDVGRAPHFDCFGPTVNLASRMESTSAPGRVQISGPTYEILSKLDKEGLFEYESPRKTLVKGFGTMVTYMVKSTTLPIPEELIDRLFIERANQRQFFAAQHAMAAEAAADAARGADGVEQSDKGSVKGGPKTTDQQAPTTPSHQQVSTQPGVVDHTPSPVAPVEQQPQAAPAALDPLPSLLPNLAPFQGGSSPGLPVLGSPMGLTEQPRSQRESNGNHAVASHSTMPSVNPPPPQSPPPSAAPMPGFQGFAMAMPPPPPPPDF